MSKAPLRERIMGNVYLIFMLRRFTSPTAVKAYVLGVSLGTAAYAVSLGNIAGNLLEVGSVGAVLNFFIGAVLNTELSIQLLLATATLSFAFLLRDLHSLARFERSLAFRSAR